MDPTNPFGMDFRKMAEQFWGAAAPPPPPQNPMEAWMRQFAPQFAPSFAQPTPAAQAQNDAVERLTAGAKQYFDFMKQASDAMTGAMPAMSPNENPMLAAMRGLTGQGATSFEDLAAQAQAAFAPMQRDFSSWFNLPTFGLTREHQSRMQALARSLAGLNEANAKYNGEMLRASRDAWSRLEKKLAERNEPGREITSLRALYDLWVDAAEEAYAEIALSKEFRAAYGDVVNAQMLVKKLVNEEIERQAQSVNMPTRSELDSVHKKLAELRRRVAALEEALERTDEATTYTDEKPQQASQAQRPPEHASQPHEASENPKKAKKR